MRSDGLLIFLKKKSVRNLMEYVVGGARFKYLAVCSLCL